MKNRKKYTNFALVREMMQTPQIIDRFELPDVEPVVEQIRKTKRVFFAGEGSGRIFPAKNAIARALKTSTALSLHTAGSLQAAEYDLSDYIVFASSNSGKTKETIEFCKKLKEKGHKNLYALTAGKNTPLEKIADRTFIITCGNEDAIAATKSYIEQALFYQALLNLAENKSFNAKLHELAKAFEQTLTAPIDSSIIQKLTRAQTVYIIGRSDGVAEELAVKVNEIIRKKSILLEGTSYLHGAQETMKPDDTALLIAPYESELQKTRDVLRNEVGVNVIAVGKSDNYFPTIKNPIMPPLTNYLYIAAGWNLLVEAGISLDINLDQAEHARKVGNVFNEKSS